MIVLQAIVNKDGQVEYYFEERLNHLVYRVFVDPVTKQMLRSTSFLVDDA